MRYQTLDEWLQWIESCHPEEIELGLDRIKAVHQRLMNRFSSSYKSPIIISVAGTNGKGTCISVMEYLLLKNSYRVGSYLSPHLVSYNERIRINGSLVDDQSLMAAFDRIDQVLGDDQLTYFEYGTLAALDMFAHQELDYVLLEVGLGGRLDAVNIIDADISVVTPIDMDHQAWLGDTREAIGYEKAGIFRSGKPAVCADPELPESVREHAQAISANCYEMGTAFQLEPSELTSANNSWRWQGIDLQGQTKQFEIISLANLARPSVAAAFQALVLSGAKLSDESAQSLDNLVIPGRFQQLHYQSTPVICDVAHNPAAAKLLASRLNDLTVTGQLVAVFAVMGDKDIPAIIEPVIPLVDQWHLVELPSQPRAKPVDELSELFNVQGIKVSSYRDMQAALSTLASVLTDQDLIIVFGSFYTVADALTIIDA